ncbi:hypothetical protein FB45DRAFT_1035871 [Roridomyces roridus]|uniref:DUF4219 domain-containing protein n=1 Tax=Roridomyces roridus TaxID=1738132 RepID=A0AAD7B9S4_9AGAR|nr:hypothetical protein FB45DRAFT_1035871 [Roridomyces roridus]
MAETTRYTMPRLNNENYAEWALRMEAVLIKKGLWTNVTSILVSPIQSDGTTVKTPTELQAERAAKMAEARAELILCVDAGQLAHMTSRDPKVVWDNLERMHRAAGFATSLALRRQFLTAKKLDSETMEAWTAARKFQTIPRRTYRQAIHVHHLLF